MNTKLKAVPLEPEKPLDHLSIKDIVGREGGQKLTPPHFEDISKREIPMSAFKKRMLELFQNGKIN